MKPPCSSILPPISEERLRGEPRTAGEAVVSRRRLIENGKLMAAGLAARSVLFAAAPGMSDLSGSDDPLKTWTIGNDRIKRTVAFHPETGLLTEQLTDLSTHADFILPGKINMGMAQEFSFLCNGHQCEGTNSEFEFVNSNESALPHGKTLTVRLRHKNLALDVSVIYIVYDGHSAVRKHLVLRNTGTEILRTRIPQYQVLADRRMSVIHDVDHGHVQREVLMAQTNGQRFSVRKSRLVRIDEFEFRIGAFALVAVAQKGEFLGHAHVDLSGQNEVRVGRQVGQLLSQQPGFRMESNCSFDPVI